MDAKITLSVPDISCGHCVSAITGALEALEGVERVDVDLGSRRVEVAGSSLDRGAIAEAIREAGYEPVVA